MKRELFRQGDVLIMRRAIPRGAKRKQDVGRIVLAEGEATGHAHAIEIPAGEDISLYEDTQGRLFLRVRSDVATVVHEEHAPIALPSGDYRVIRQREYSPEEIRNVAD